jgi:hypothetical protein
VDPSPRDVDPSPRRRRARSSTVEIPCESRRVNVRILIFISDRPPPAVVNQPVARPIAPLPRPNPNANPAAGIRGAAGRVHARTEAALSLGYGDVLAAEIGRAQERTEQALSTNAMEWARLRGALLARTAFVETLFTSPGIVAAATAAANWMGSRVQRPRPLEFDDLFVGSARPAPLTTDRHHQTCSVCRQVKSHPVS